MTIHNDDEEFDGTSVEMSDIIGRNTDAIIEELRSMAIANKDVAGTDDPYLILTHGDIHDLMTTYDLPVTEKSFRATFVNSFNEVMRDINRDIHLVHVSRATLATAFDGLQNVNRFGRYLLTDAYTAALVMNERDKRFVINKIGYAHARAAVMLRYVARTQGLAHDSVKYKALETEMNTWATIAHTTQGMMSRTPNGAPAIDLTGPLRLRDGGPEE